MRNTCVGKEPTLVQCKLPAAGETRGACITVFHPGGKRPSLVDSFSK